ncbi:RagB/SusD family nutrient uptake outer membrane protein [Flavobacterium rhamnosiphilum]|uniref:RagB/SusD family nutrient uptake outer membrane protein n=2 Tax=Flavobacterium rhamnosiphilum TaxID=2541724 RepID=A0A4R5FBJ2_9FLAO|nr:RagB/SusD family nutrient uptake outer membrane protein [Flavobacterium rhamnosiphilum]
MKMKKNIKIRIVTLVFGLFVFSGCADLDQEPLSLATPDNFWVSQPNAESALAGCYGLLKNALVSDANFLLWGEFGANTFMNSRSWIVGAVEDGNYHLMNGYYRPNTLNWRGFYRTANWALAIEKHVNEMPDSSFKSLAEKNRIIGEAAFIRSLSYFYMARIWGDVPIVDEVIETSDQLIKDGNVLTLPQQNEKKVLDYSLAAANKSISLLEYSSPGTDRWAIQANKASAEALKAHIALWYAARDNGNQQMVTESIAAATSVINNSNASLVDYVNEGVTGFNTMCLGKSKTGLFEINISSDTNESFRMSTGDNSHTGLTLNFPIFRFINASGATPFIDPAYYGNTMMKATERANDVRKTLFFYNIPAPGIPVPPADVFLMKYSHQSKDPNATDAYAQFSESNILIFRLADIYLLRAEANMKSGNFSAAITDLNTIRSKANVPNYTGASSVTALTKAIFDERAIELVGEGQACFDRIRLNYYTGVNWMNSARISQKGNFWPIMPGVISINPVIVQPEFWKGKL